jgi:hypothetical protein
MRLSRLFLSLAGLAILFICVAPGWADKIPTKRPSSYGDNTAEIQLTSPSFSPVTQDGVTVSLNSVFCNSCQVTPTNLEYFFDITLTAGATLNSLSFGPGFDTDNSLAFALVQFNPVVDLNDPNDPNAGDACTDGTNFTCKIPYTSPTLDLSGIGTNLTCDQVTGICTIDFTGFNFAALGGGPIVLGAEKSSTDTKTPFLPSVSINGSTATVPEPGSIWFAAIVLVAFVMIFMRHQRKLGSLAI